MNFWLWTYSFSKSCGTGFIIFDFFILNVIFILDCAEIFPLSEKLQSVATAHPALNTVSGRIVAIKPFQFLIDQAFCEERFNYGLLSKRQAYVTLVEFFLYHGPILRLISLRVGANDT